MFVASCGARDQALVADLQARQGRRPALLVVALLAAGCACALSAWFGSRMLLGLPPAARALVAALALVLAGAEMLVLGPRRAPREPTHSLFAAWLVLLGLEVTDAARFLVVALAVGTASPIPAGLGGALGSMAALAAGWGWPELMARPALGPTRRALGAVLLVLGLCLAVPNLIGLQN